MKKFILGVILSISILSCSKNKYDGIYNGKVEFMGMDFIDLTYKINGSELIIDNGLSEPTHIKCKQIENGIEYQNENGETIVIYISDSGELMVNDKITLRKVQTYSESSESNTKTLVEIENGNIDDFYSVSSEYDKEEKPTDIVYIYKGNLKNTSTQLFEDTTINLEINLILENGNILTEREYGSGFLGEGIMAINSVKDWKPNEIREVKGFLSIDIPVKYIDYPIKSVVAKYSFKCEDQINNKTESFFIEKDITEKWKSVSIRVREGNTDYNKKAEIRELFY